MFRHAKSVARAGYDVDLICPWGPASVEIPHGLRIVSFPRIQRRAARFALIPRRILPLLFARKYDLYHFHDLDILPLMAAVRVLSRKPVIYDCHENYADEMRVRAYKIPAIVRMILPSVVKWIERIAAGALRYVIIVVPQQRRTFPAPWYRTLLVRNFAELSIENGRVDDLQTRADACVSTASQYITNGALFILEVAHEVIRRRPHVQFYAVDRFLTDQELRETVRRRVDELGLQRNFTLLPNLPPHEIMKNLNRATIGLSLTLPTPNHLDALPGKLVEYMAAGLAIVAADLPNTRELVEEASSGVLAVPGNAVSFADKICELIDNKNERLQLAAQGIDSFRKKLNWEVEVEKTLHLYRELLPA